MFGFIVYWNTKSGRSAAYIRLNSLYSITSFMGLSPFLDSDFSKIMRAPNSANCPVCSSGGASNTTSWPACISDLITSVRKRKNLQDVFETKHILLDMVINCCNKGVYKNRCTFKRAKCSVRHRLSSPTIRYHVHDPLHRIAPRQLIGSIHKDSRISINSISWDAANRCYDTDGSILHGFGNTHSHSFLCA